METVIVYFQSLKTLGSSLSWTTHYTAEQVDCELITADVITSLSPLQTTRKTFLVIPHSELEGTKEAVYYENQRVYGGGGCFLHQNGSWYDFETSATVQGNRYGTTIESTTENGVITATRQLQALIDGAYQASRAWQASFRVLYPGYKLTVDNTAGCNDVTTKVYLIKDTKTYAIPKGTTLDIPIAYASTANFYQSNGRNANGVFKHWLATYPGQTQTLGTEKDCTNNYTQGTEDCVITPVWDPATAITLDNTTGLVRLSIRCNDGLNESVTPYDDSVAIGAEKTYYIRQGENFSFSLESYPTNADFSHWEKNGVDIGSGGSYAAISQTADTTATYVPIWLPRKLVSIDNSQGYEDITIKITGFNTLTLPAGQKAGFYAPNGKTFNLSYPTGDTDEGKFVYWEQDGVKVSTAISAYFDPPEDHTYITPIWTDKYAITIIAPQEAAITYRVGLSSEELYPSTILPAGESVTLRVYNLSNTDKMTLNLELDYRDFDLDTFKGWTKDGTVIDRWSNPATIVAAEAATYSCIIGEAVTPTDTGALLYGNYGELLYAGDTTPGESHTIEVQATFTDSGHNITFEVGTESGLEHIETTFSKSVTITDTTSESTGGLLYADKVLSAKPFLAKVFFHCQVPEHMYSVIIKLDGTQIYSEDYLSGTFSKTFEI